MLEPWNDIFLCPPPTHTIKGCKDNLRSMTVTCKDIIRNLSKQSSLHQESAIISRFVYKFDKKFRNDIGYRNLRKVITALRKYLKLNLINSVENFHSTLPSSTNEYAPTRQMLQYLLIRIISFSKLMLRIYVCSKQTCVFYLDRVKRGERHWMSLMPYASLSRVFLISKNLLRLSCVWYGQLFQFHSKLQLEGLPFLPENFELPFNLDDFLDINNIDTFGKYEWHQKTKSKIDYSVFDDDEADDFDILKYVKEINRDDEKDLEVEMCESNSLKSLEAPIPSMKYVDQGVSISRETFNDKNTLISEQHSTDSVKSVKSLNVFVQKEDNLRNAQSDDSLTAKYVDQGVAISRKTFNNKNTLISEQHSTDSVKSVKSLNVFIEKEDNLRNTQSDDSLTKHLSFMQWHALKKLLMDIANPLNKNNKVQKKFNKIWKEKCLDYL